MRGLLAGWMILAEAACVYFGCLVMIIVAEAAWSVLQMFPDKGRFFKIHINSKSNKKAENVPKLMLGFFLFVTRVSHIAEKY